MEPLAYTYAALSYEEQRRSRLTVSLPFPHRFSLQRVMGATALALTILAAGIAGTMVSPFGVEAQTQTPTSLLP